MKKIYLLPFLVLSYVFAQIPNYVPTNGLEAWYSFDGNSNDATNNGHDGTNIGAIAVVTGHDGTPNSAYQFNGLNYVSLPSFLGPSFSIAFWIKLPSNGSGSTIINKWNSGQQTSSFLIWDNFTSNPGLTWNDGTQFNNNFINNSWRDNQWHHVAVSFENQAVNGSKFYFDGSLVSTAPGGTYVATAYDIWLSTGRTSTGQPQNGTESSMDNLGFWNRVLESCEIEGLYLSNISCTTNIKEKSESIGIQLYPNPSEGLIYLNFEKEIKGEVHVRDILGNTILTQAIDGKSSVIDHSNKPAPGIYFVEFINDNGETIKVKKVMLK